MALRILIFYTAASPIGIPLESPVIAESVKGKQALAVNTGFNQKF